MAKNKNLTKETDGLYFLKIVLYFLLGCLWVQINSSSSFALPVGLALGLLFASHDHFRIDRKVEIAVLLVSCILSYFLPIGFVLTVG